MKPGAAGFFNNCQNMIILGGNFVSVSWTLCKWLIVLTLSTRSWMIMGGIIKVELNISHIYQRCRYNFYTQQIFYNADRHSKSSSGWYSDPGDDLFGSWSAALHSLGARHKDHSSWKLTVPGQLVIYVVKILPETLHVCCRKLPGLPALPDSADVIDIYNIYFRVATGLKCWEIYVILSY